MDTEIADLSKTFSVTVENEDNNITYKIDTEGSKTLEEFKLLVARKSQIPFPSQIWEDNLKNEDDRNTMSSVIKRHGSYFEFRQSSPAASYSRPMYRNYSPSFGTNNDPPSTNGNHQSSPDQSDVESLMSSDADDDYFIDDVDAFRSSANAQLMPEAVQDERAALNQFKTEFTKRYRQQQQPGPNFSTKIFSEAVQEAFGGSAQSRRALAIYLHHDKSVMSNVFCSQMLCTEAVSQLLNANFLSWAWDMTTAHNKNKFLNTCKQYSEDIYNQVRYIKVDEYPVVVLLTGRGRQCEVQEIIKGTTDIDELYNKIMRTQDAMIRSREQQVREEHLRQDRERIIKEQKEAYERSLEIDRQKKLKQEEEARRVANEELLKQTAEESKQAEIARLQSLVPVEPPLDKNACTIRFRLPTGELKNRRFVHSVDNLQSVVDFVGSLGYLTNEFHIIKSYPKDNISKRDLSQSIKNSGIAIREQVIIEEICEEE